MLGVLLALSESPKVFPLQIARPDETCVDFVSGLLTSLESTPKDAFFCSGDFESLTLQNDSDVFLSACAFSDNVKLESPALAHKLLSDSLGSGFSGVCVRADTLQSV